MRQRIRSALFRTLTFLLALLMPATGRRRRAGVHVPAAVAPLPPPRPRKWARTPLLDGGPIFVDDRPIVRPYLLAYERQVAAA